MTFARLWAFLAVALPTLAALIASLSTVDLAYQLRAGAEVLDGRGIPTVDTWTFTAAGATWFDQQWGAQVLLAAVYRAAGWTGLLVLRALFVAVIFGCLLEIGRRRGLGLRRSAWLTLAAFVVAAAALGLRPQIMGMALLAVVLLLVSDRRSHPGRLWAVPLIVLIWANIHGSFFLGPLVLALAWLEDLHDRVDRPNRTLMVAVVAATAACVTPSGPAVWAYAVGLSTNSQVTARISEWQATSLRDIPGIVFFGSVLAVVALLARRERPTPWPTLAWLAVFFLVGAYAVRGVAWWPLGAVVAIAGLLVTDGSPDENGPTRAGTLLTRRLNLAIAAALAIVGVVLIPWWRPVDPVLGAPRGVLVDAPAGMTAALRTLARPGDRLFNPQPLGSWFEFAVPDLPVAIDSRIELFPVAVWERYERIVAGGDNWSELLADWNVTLVATVPAEAALTARLTAAGWRTAYSDIDGTILMAPGR
jgi:hypothetical protein